MDKIIPFVKRMGRLGINIKLTCSYPWVFIYKINNNLVKDRFLSEHGFTMMFLPIREGQTSEFTDIGEIFKLIRKYTKKTKERC